MKSDHMNGSIYIYMTACPRNGVIMRSQGSAAPVEPSIPHEENNSSFALECSSDIIIVPSGTHSMAVRKQEQYVRIPQALVFRSPD